MRPALPTLNRIAVTAHPHLPEAVEEAAQVVQYLQDQGVEAQFGRLYDDDLRQRIQTGAFDLLIALGGDGTMLRAGHLCGPSETPILGVNLGRFGFLIEIQQHEWPEAIPRLLAGDYWLEQRMMLCAELWRGEQRLGNWEVLNEVVVTRGSLVRPVHLVANIDGRFLTTYVADALIASTATGSTAYALAAGGPILPPELRNILLVAVAPHLSLDRAVVLPEGAAVSIQVYTDHQAVLSVDGQPPVEMASGDRVDTFASSHTVMFVRFQEPGYFYRNLIQHMDQNPSTGGRK
jgi:NAD+ kinase